MHTYTHTLAARKRSSNKSSTGRFSCAMKSHLIVMHHEEVMRRSAKWGVHCVHLGWEKPSQLLAVCFVYLRIDCVFVCCVKLPARLHDLQRNCDIGCLHLSPWGHLARSLSWFSHRSSVAGEESSTVSAVDPGQCGSFHLCSLIKRFSINVK